MPARRILTIAALVLMSTMSAATAESYKHDPTFAVPGGFFNDPDFHPVGYLTSFPVKDTAQKLDAKRRSALRLLFIASYCACKAKLRQDYPIATSTALYRLLLTNYPKVASVRGEGGKVVMLGRLAKVLEDERP